MAHSLSPPPDWLQPATGAAPGSCPLYHALASLPRRHRQALLLARIDELGFAEIAQHLGLCPERIETHLTCALNTLGQRLRTGSAQASAWYTRLQNPAITPSERIDFRRWLDASPSHLQAFHETELLWRSLLEPSQALLANGAKLQARRKASLGRWIAALTILMLVSWLSL
ncbi:MULTISPECIES: DUF4880 domain-containing protein [unclassified Pseudomonas]|uniref:DUF4880 domain-containing protein n=1 Tax=unclassified Pseudomonas TaxID=196821 RepID=UPI000BC8D5BE|nr:MULTISPECIES: DUF4880 domain-containing protein [unclassified Pseudomonas]PVZ20292.1 sigma-70-like protein [Pseudomonas sp. URIL14HWK12:I12]PVZ27358.1 sigma-70-like protein [Pseudomonas sp. URIL14HWK12:I10]PVZ38247.1 sigma-70-like protein [Pseudomonas sp. URIL14HWK12:I11]SNZ04118.1 Fe2+-dicitrate sensor, membrane component [Pseudomonas sp. URIL14HWK12:I9]